MKTLSRSRHQDMQALRLTIANARVGYWGGMDTEQTIAEIQCLKRIFALPDAKPLKWGGNTQQNLWVLLRLTGLSMPAN